MVLSSQHTNVELKGTLRWFGENGDFVDLTHLIKNLWSKMFLARIGHKVKFLCYSLLCSKSINVQKITFCIERVNVHASGTFTAKSYL